MKNNEGLTSAECAVMNGYHSTSQAIMGYARPIEKVEPILNYLINQKPEELPTMMEKLTNLLKALQDFFSIQGLISLLRSTGKRIRAFFSHLMRGKLSCMLPDTGNTTVQFPSTSDILAANNASSRQEDTIQSFGNSTIGLGAV